MPTKDRLLELQQAANIPGSNEEKQPKNEKENREDVLKSLAKIDVVKKWIDAITENTKLCDQILNGNLINNSEEQAKLEATFKNSETVGFNVITSLKQINDDLTKYGWNNNAEYRMKYLHYVSLKQRFQEVIKEHQNCVVKHREIRKDILKKCNKIVNDDEMSEDNLEQTLDKNETQMFVQNYLSKERDAKLMLADVERRHLELLAIEKHLTEVRDLFVKISILVEQQQESINRIEYHALSATDYIEDTVDELQIASKRKKKTRKIKTSFAVAGVVIIVFMIIGIIYF